MNYIVFGVDANGEQCYQCSSITSRRRAVIHANSILKSMDHVEKVVAISVKANAIDFHLGIGVNVSFHPRLEFVKERKK